MDRHDDVDRNTGPPGARGGARRLGGSLRTAARRARRTPRRRGLVGRRSPSSASATPDSSPSPYRPSSAGWAPPSARPPPSMRELAHHCGSTALALSMHQHVTNFTAWRYRRELPGAEATLRRIVDDRIVIVSTGGGDFVRPRGEAVRVDGGYQVSGRKIFASQSPVGTVMSTMFPFDDPERGLRVLNMAVPFNDPGVTVHDNWDTLGMRGTASNDVDDRRRLRARRAGPRRPALRGRRSAAAGDRQHRLPDHRAPSTSASPRRRATRRSPPSPTDRGPTTRSCSARSA